jgi:hypothetical protein
MFHYIYKVYDPSGRFYIGRHSTENINDGYMGSGKWVRSIKEKGSLKKEIVKFVENFETLIQEEKEIITKFIDDPLNMNFSTNSFGFSYGDMNPSRSDKGRKRMRENNWMKSIDGRIWFSKNNPSKKDSVKLKRSVKSKEQLENNTHNFQNHDVVQKKVEVATIRCLTHNPMWNDMSREKVSTFSIERYKNGTHNFCDPDTIMKTRSINRERLLKDNPMKNPEISSKFKNRKRLSYAHTVINKVENQL